jgi:hypothetical protein
MQLVLHDHPGSSRLLTLTLEARSSGACLQTNLSFCSDQNLSFCSDQNILMHVEYQALSAAQKANDVHTMFSVGSLVEPRCRGASNGPCAPSRTDSKC